MRSSFSDEVVALMDAYVGMCETSLSMGAWALALSEEVEDLRAGRRVRKKVLRDSRTA